MKFLSGKQFSSSLQKLNIGQWRLATATNMMLNLSSLQGGAIYS